jgi:alpha-1,2-mannosyltransferase
VLISLSTPFLIATSWPHYFVFLPFVQLFLLHRALNGRADALGRLAVFLFLWAPAVVLTSVAFFHGVGSWRIYNGLGAIFLAVLLLDFAAWVLLLRGRKAAL